MSYIHVVNENIERVTKGKYDSYDSYIESKKYKELVIIVLSVIGCTLFTLYMLFNHQNAFGDIIYAYVIYIVIGIGLLFMILTGLDEWLTDVDKKIIHQHCIGEQDQINEIIQTIEHHIGTVRHPKNVTIKEMYDLNEYYMRLKSLRESGIPSVLIDR